MNKRGYAPDDLVAREADEREVVAVVNGYRPFHEYLISERGPS